MKGDDLVGIAEIAERTGNSRQTISNWRARRADFPLPTQDLQSGPVWEWRVVKDWLDTYEGRKAAVISFINLKGGVGKTTIAVAVSEILSAEMGKRVLFIDIDPQTNGTVALIGEERWKQANEAGRTVAHLYEDALNPERSLNFQIDDAILRRVSDIGGGVPRLDLLASSIELINIQDALPLAGFKTNYQVSPLDILRNYVEPVLGAYEFVIIDCPPSLGLLTQGALTISNAFLIPTIPDILSTWGIYQIVKRVSDLARTWRTTIRPVGIVINKIQENMDLHIRTMEQIQQGKLFPKESNLEQPPIFKSVIKQNVDVTRAAEYLPGSRTLKQKYGPNYQSLYELAQEVAQRCKIGKN